MKKYILIAIFTGFVGILSAQEVVSSAGNHAEASGIQLSWTLGEPVIETVSNGNNILTQGFHQTNLTVTALDKLTFPGLELTVYPNPVNQILNIKATGRDDIQLNYSLFGIDGKMLVKREIVNNPEEINLLPYASGNYLLKIVNDDDKPVQSFKIVKR